MRFTPFVIFIVGIVHCQDYYENEEIDDEGIAGLGRYPTYKTIPKTGFSCEGRVNWGYYADIEADCQVFHVCESAHSKISFLCPIGSAFNQKHLVCDWWYNFDCSDAISMTSLYDIDYHQQQQQDTDDDVNRLGFAKRHGNDYDEYDDGTATT